MAERINGDSLSIATATLDVDILLYYSRYSAWQWRHSQFDTMWPALAAAATRANDYDLDLCGHRTTAGAACVSLGPCSGAWEGIDKSAGVAAPLRCGAPSGASSSLSGSLRDSSTSRSPWDVNRIRVRRRVPVIATSTAQAPAAPAVHGYVPPDFGRQGGTPISNADTVLDEVDAVLGREGRPPAVEYLFVRPFVHVRVPLLDVGFSYNAYGHAAVRYTRPNGEQVVMNIVGKKLQSDMVQFTTPSRYMFGVDFDDTTEQKGVYNRDIVGLRVEDVPPADVEAMHQFYTALAEDHRHGLADFNIMLGAVYNALAWLNLPIAKRGNCAHWTSKGLVTAGLMRNPSIWPKSILIHMFENQEKLGYGGSAKPDNVHIVSYRRPRHAQLTYGVDAVPLSAVAPLQSIRSFAYMDLERFADVIVEVPKNDIVAVVRRADSPPERPSEWRNTLNSKWAITTSSIVTMAAIAVFTGVLRRRSLTVEEMAAAMKRRRQALRRRAQH